MLICPNCGEELRFWDELHRCQWATEEGGTMPNQIPETDRTLAQPVQEETCKRCGGTGVIEEDTIPLTEYSCPVCEGEES